MDILLETWADSSTFASTLSLDIGTDPSSSSDGLEKMPVHDSTSMRITTPPASQSQIQEDAIAMGVAFYNRMEPNKAIKLTGGVTSPPPIPSPSPPPLKPPRRPR